jgi:hypothetical protein
MTGPYTRGADLARDIVRASQARSSLLSDAAALVEELRQLPADTAADVLVVWLDAAGSFGRIAESEAARARQDEARSVAAAAEPSNVGHKPPAEDPFVGLAEAAAELGVAEATVRTWTRPREGRPQLMVSRPGRGIWQFRRSWLDDFRDANAPEPAPSTAPVRPDHVPDPRSTAALETAPARRRTRRRKGSSDLPLVPPNNGRGR